MDKNTNTELSKNEDAETDIQPPLSVSYSEKSYEQCSPPVCYVELAGHKSAKVCGTNHFISGTIFEHLLFLAFF